LEKGLFFVAGEFRKLPTEYYEGDLNHPPDFQDAIDKAKALQPREEPPNIPLIARTRHSRKEGAIDV